MAGRELGRGRRGTRPSSLELQAQLGRDAVQTNCPPRSLRPTAAGSTTRARGPRRRDRRAEAEGVADRASRATAGCSASSSSRWATRRRLSSTCDGRTSCATRSCASRACASTSATCSRRWSRSASSTRRRSPRPRGSRAPRPSTAPGRCAILARCRALLLAARGDLEGAFASSTTRSPSTLAWHGSVPPRADAARARENAAAGEEARRCPHDARGSARGVRAPRCAALGRAGPGRAGAHRRARALARRVDGGRARIAALVAEGSTNREVAAALFLTEHSVETALTRDLPEARRPLPRRARPPPGGG